MWVSRTWWILGDSGRGESGGDMRIEFSGRVVERGDDSDGRRRMARVGWALEDGGSCSEAARGNTGDLGGLREGAVLLWCRGEGGRGP